MRVTLVIAGPWPALRGSQVLVDHLAAGLRQRGHRVHIVSYGRGHGVRPGLYPGRAVLDVWLTVRLAAHVARVAPDVVHAHNYEAALAALAVRLLSGCPVVYHGHCAMAHELPTYVTRPWARRLLATIGAALDRAVPRRADFCIAVTEELGRELGRRGVLPSALACILPTGHPAELGPARGLAGPPEDELVCYAGNLDGYQNLDFLLESFVLVRQAVPGARLRLVTHGEALRQAASLGARADEAGVEMVVAGSYAEVQEHLARAAVAVLPRSEASGFPMKLLNYMAAGKAIVACAGSAKGLVDGVTARVVPDGDAGAFARAVVELLGDREERMRLGAAARAVVGDPAAWDEVLDRVESIYRQVVLARSAVTAATATER